MIQKISQLKPNPNNPRFIKDEKFKKLVQSIKDFPEMLKIRPIVINLEKIVLGGNMRLKAAVDAGLKEVPVVIADLTKEQEKEFIIKDNIGFGQWDWDIIANEWDTDKFNNDVANMQIDDAQEDARLNAELARMEGGSAAASLRAQGTKSLIQGIGTAARTLYT